MQIHVTVHTVVDNGNNSLIVALVGVAVGSLLTFLAGIALSRRRTKAQVRAAAQLMSTDLIGKSMATILLTSSNVWLPLGSVPFLTDREAWREARGDLAFGDREAWLTVSSVFVEVAHVERLALTNPGRPLSPSDRQTLASLQSSITQAIVLLGILKEQPPWYRAKAQVKHWSERREALRRVRKARLEQAELLSSGSGEQAEQTQSPVKGDPTASPPHRRVIFGRSLPRWRAEEAYLRTLHNWFRDRT